MGNLFLSRFETYLLDEDMDLVNEENHSDKVELEINEYEEFPKGFFSSL